jgi:RimJ/RimL family protein N-acetyltransferase
MQLTFEKLTSATPEVATILNKWANDPMLVPLMRPSRSKEELEAPTLVTVESLAQRLEHDVTYLIRVDGQLVGEMNFQVNPGHLYKKETDTAWIGIGIGEASARGKGVGTKSMTYLENQIQSRGLKRIELGVFEYNTNAIKLYKKLGYQEIGRVDEFAYWQGRMWQDIRMEKYLE